MTLSETLKSGKPFRRKGDLNYYRTLSEYMAEFGLREEDVTAEDWEIVNETLIPITEYQIKELLEEINGKLDKLVAKTCIFPGINES